MTGDDVITDNEKGYILERVDMALAAIKKHSGRAERKIGRLLREVKEVVKREADAKAEADMEGLEKW